MCVVEKLATRQKKGSVPKYCQNRVDGATAPQKRKAKACPIRVDWLGGGSFWETGAVYIKKVSFQGNTSQIYFILTSWGKKNSLIAGIGEARDWCLQTLSLTVRHAGAHLCGCSSGSRGGPALSASRASMEAAAQHAAEARAASAPQTRTALPPPLHVHAA